jgi:hypothetical protein
MMEYWKIGEIALKKYHFFINPSMIMMMITITNKP